MLHDGQLIMMDIVIVCFGMIYEVIFHLEHDLAYDNLHENSTTLQLDWVDQT